VIHALEPCDLLIEMHGENAEENAAFARHFGANAAVLEHPPVDPAAVESLAFLGVDAARMASEYRANQQWLWRSALQFAGSLPRPVLTS